MHGVYIGNNRVLISLTWGGLLIVPADDLGLTPILIHSGQFELPLTKYLFNTVKPGMTVVDVGAHVGYYTVMLGHLVGEKGRVFAYEANPTLYRFMRDNVHINYLQNFVTSFQAAVYARSTTLEFHVTERFTSNSSIYPRADSYEQEHEDTVRTIMVPAVPLDAALQDVEHVDLIKMDIEGAEFQAFLGMQKTLQRYAIDTIVFEYAPTMLRDDLHPLWNALDQLRQYYDFFVPDNEGTPKAYPLETLMAQTFLHSIIMKKKQ